MVAANARMKISSAFAVTKKYSCIRSKRNSDLQKTTISSAPTTHINVFYTNYKYNVKTQITIR